MKLHTLITYRLRLYIPHRSKVERARIRKQWKMFYLLSSETRVLDAHPKLEKRTQLEIGLFDCPKCKKPFQEVLSKKKI
jgi:hypothetical protein